MIADRPGAHPAFGAVLEAEAAACRAEWLELRARLNVLEPRMYALNTLLALHELPTLEDCLPRQPATSSMPARQSAHRHLSVHQALLVLLADGTPQHADNLTRALYMVDGNDGAMRQARQNIISAGHRGVTAGHLVRTAPNTFARPPRPGESDG